ncbi:MAG: 4'-phosphopantetheinyl transferase superfamily protein [Xanthomonadales bacterium]|nr:4'-phosphopantetheinyl transferase superfamily protein [Xanthomonadales bacterium]
MGEETENRRIGGWNGGWIGRDEFVPVRMPLQQLTRPAEQQIHLWYLDLAELGGSLRQALGGQSRGGQSRGGESPDDRMDVQRLRFARRFYLRLLLGAYLGLPGKDVVINRSNRGKPVLDAGVHDSTLKFSMAKSENRLLIGISASRHIGVDLEPQWRKAREPLRLAQRYFSAAEFSALQQVPAARLDEAFLRAWACNEAVVKASGLGIANQLCRFTVQMDPDLPPALLDIENDRAGDWSLNLVRPSTHFIGAVATRQHLDQVRCCKLLAAS